MCFDVVYKSVRLATNMLYYLDMVPVPANIQAYLHSNNLPNLSYTPGSDNDPSREANLPVGDNNQTRPNTGCGTKTDSITQKEKRCASATFTRDFKYKKTMSQHQGYADPPKSSLSIKQDPYESVHHQSLGKSVSEHKTRNKNNNNNNSIMNKNTKINGSKSDHNKNHTNNNNNYYRPKSKSLSQQISSKIPRFLKSSSPSSNEQNCKENRHNGLKDNDRYSYYEDDNNNNINCLSSSHIRYSSLDSEDSSSTMSDFSFTTNASPNSSLNSSLNNSISSHYIHHQNNNNNNVYLTTPSPHGKRTNSSQQRESTNINTVVVEQRRCHSALSYRSTRKDNSSATSTSARPGYQRERSGIPVATKNKKYRSKSCERRPIRSKTSPEATKAEPQRPKSSFELRTPSSSNRCRSPGIPIRINSNSGRGGQRTQRSSQQKDDDVFVTLSSSHNLQTSRPYYCNSSSFSAPSRDYFDGFPSRSSSPTNNRNRHNNDLNNNSSNLRRSSCGGSSSGGTTSSVSRSLEYEAAELKVIFFKDKTNFALSV